MDALNMAAPSSGSGEAPRSILPAPVSHIPPRVEVALHLLLEAFDYAHELDADPWEFAVEIAVLREVKVTSSDLRWLAGRELIEHGVEVTVGDQARRSFQHPGRLRLSRKTCFVLTENGAALARQFARRDAARDGVASPAAGGAPSLSVAAPPVLPVPRWDRDRTELRVGGFVVKRFKIPALHQESILAAFEELHWPPRIDDPLRDGEEQAEGRLQQVVDDLNRQQKTRLIQFAREANGRGVRWEYCSSASVLVHH
jgi:hypothetical protein